MPCPHLKDAEPVRSKAGRLVKGWGIQVEPGRRAPAPRRTRRTGRRKRANRWTRRIYAVVRRKQAVTVLSAVFCVLIALVITAVLAVPHAGEAPVEAAASAEPEPTATPAPVESAEASEPPTSAAEAVIDENYVQLDDWQLVLVNDTVPLPDDFVVTPQLYDGVQINSRMYTALRDLLRDASDAGVSLWVASAYRSVEEQEQILENAIQNRMNDYGMTREEAEENALLTIQKPGHSEHHTGLAVDFNNVARDFENTDAYAWLMENAEKYGFVERYPEDKEEITGIDYECWHFRYVGRDNAAAMNELGMCLEEYVLYLKNQQA